MVFFVLRLDCVKQLIALVGIGKLSRLLNRKTKRIALAIV